MTCIVSKVLYSLDLVWLLKAERAKLDAFHHFCLRKILRIPPSYVSRVTNADVLASASVPLLSDLLATRQNNLYQCIAAAPQESYAKALVCDPTGQPRQWWRNRRRGRPRQMWSSAVHDQMSDPVRIVYLFFRIRDPGQIRFSQFVRRTSFFKSFSV